MHRPNRIGPTPFSSIDGSLYNFAGTTIETALGDLRDGAVWMDDGVPPDDTKARRLTVTGGVTLADGESFRIGIRITGGTLGVASIFELAGSVSYQADAGIRAYPIFGRTSFDTNTSGLSTYDLVPAVDSGGFLSFNDQLIGGRFGSSADEGSLPLALAIWFVNRSGASADVDDVVASLSVNRYLSDTLTFDPNR